MRELLQLVLKVSLLVFMLGSLGAMGLELALDKAISALRNLRFLVLTVVLGFVICPALAYAAAKALSLQPPHAMGLLLLGMAPAAPFMPLVVRRATSDLAYTAAFMVVSSIGTVVFMPVAAPVLIKGLNAGAWTIGRPLLLFVLAPLLVGAMIRAAHERLASWLYLLVRPITNVAAVVMLLVLVIIYGRGFVSLVGTYAIAAQIIFIAATTCVAFWLSVGLRSEERIVLSIGTCTRNIGAAFAPLVAMKADPNAIIMVAFAVPVTLLGSFGAARWLARHVADASAAGPRTDAARAR